MSNAERVKTQSQNGIVDFGSEGTIPVYNLRSFLSQHGLTERIFDLVKLDCECCEYSVIPDAAGFLTSKSKVVSLTGEIHGCGHVDADIEERTIEILGQRGCTFPLKNFRENGRFYETANLNDYCTNSGPQGRRGCEGSPPTWPTNC